MTTTIIAFRSEQECGQLIAQDEERVENQPGPCPGQDNRQQLLSYG
ncbi:hypothetical protein [Sphingobium sp. CFD-2]|nr:hypothetical protein [Sphingobium sp. CFD-2]